MAADKVVGGPVGGECHGANGNRGLDVQSDEAVMKTADVSEVHSAPVLAFRIGAVYRPQGWDEL